MLQPKRVKYRRPQDGRGNKGNAHRGTQLAFGSFGIKTLEAKWLDSRQIEAARVAINRYMNREGQVWIRIFPDKPITRKPADKRRVAVPLHSRTGILKRYTLFNNFKNQSSMNRKMKSVIIAVAALFACTATASAQKYALMDMEYILKNIPAYERANEQLNQTSKAWQTEVEALNNEAQTLYKNYQNESVFLSEAQKKEREQAIVAKEKEAAELKKKYFGPDGELFKKRQSLLEPIQDEIYNAVKGIAQQRGFQLILDRASDNGIIFASPSIDISNEVLAKLGYSK